MSKKVRLIYARSSTFVGRVIRAAKWWPGVSHVGILTDGDDTVLHSAVGDGVVEDRARDFYDKYRGHDIVEVDADYDLTIAFAREQIGCRYDYGAIARAVSRVWPGDAESWSAAELVEASLMAGGNRRFRIPLDRVTVQQSYIVA